MIKILGQITELVNSIQQTEQQLGQHSDIEKFVISYDSVQKLIQLQGKLKKEKEGKEVNNGNNGVIGAPEIEHFTKWLNDNGCKEAFEKVKIVSGLNEGAGLVAKSDLKQGDLLLSIPQPLFMSQETAFKAFGEKIKNEAIFRALPSLALTVQLIQEYLNPKSFWAPYIKMLPRQVKTVLSFTLEELQLLRGSSASHEAISIYRNTIRQYCYLYNFFQRTPGIIATSQFTWELFVWAISTFMSRQNEIPIIFRGQHIGNQMALIPLWDLCNHVVEGTITTFYEEDAKRLTMTSLKDFKEGEQVMMHYGDRGNGKLLFYSGFTVPENKYDDVKIMLALDPEDPHAHEKLHILENRGMAGTITLLIPNTPQHLDESLIPFFRVVAMSEEEVKQFTPSSAFSGGHGHNHHTHTSNCNHRPTKTGFKVVSERNEKLAFIKALGYIKKRLQAYPSTIEEDEKLIVDPKLNDLTKSIIQLRLSEKRIITRYIKFLESELTKGVMNIDIYRALETDQDEEEECNDDHHGHSHGGGDHGHSHGGGNQHGHSHAGGDHGHSHGGSNQHGHSHSGGDHGHSHGGSNQHGHSHAGGNHHGHSH